jgi:hypothetical protein
MFNFLDSFSSTSGVLSKCSNKELVLRLCSSVYSQMIHAVQWSTSCIFFTLIIWKPITPLNRLIILLDNNFIRRPCTDNFMQISINEKKVVFLMKNYHVDLPVSTSSVLQPRIDSYERAGCVCWFRISITATTYFLSPLRFCVQLAMQHFIFLYLTAY